MAGCFWDGITIRVIRSTGPIILAINEDGPTCRAQHRIVLRPFNRGSTFVSETFSPFTGRDCHYRGTR
ncbi:hypothetical protein BDV37DRAFT_264449 [Aspergillus pseudonomiae]|uniref:Uncharacterized protein n=1 Tax=Aspergillus pseudonomiae TaxID=1506151 RepID=A0A5N7CVJ2_9EURO|nr:uncharacterized protein BDV37DRAFT_264449 [Aspergillus pseudonomiae]KAE8397989.1 hypothetical protein BDV37DRAFT_264449 [Aspergillus pseudonomiae]